jgi:multidrug efflux pump subunit AcrB
MKIIRQMIVLAAAVAFLVPAVRCEQAQKAASHLSQDDRIKKLEERADAAEKTASSATMERDYITRTQKQYEAYYEKVLNTQLWTLGMMGLLLTAVFVLVARFSLKMIDEQTKTATAGATVQMRNEYARAMAKEVQKLWDSNSADNKKLKDALTTQIAEMEQKLKDRSDFQMQFVQALAGDVREQHGDAVAMFRKALSAYKSGKPRNVVEAKVGAITVRCIFESLQKAHGENHVEKAREEMSDALYNGLDEELALAALQASWLTPLINERRPAVPPEAPQPEPAAEAPPPTPLRQFISADADLPLDDECDSCRLITT